MTKILFSLVFGFSSLLHAEELSTQLQKACIQEQLKEHQGINKPALRAQDFTAYCSCESDYIQKNTSDAQKNELNKSSKNIEFLLGLKAKAIKICLDPGQKITS